MKLTGQQLQRIYEAILDGYDSDSLRKMVRIRLDEHLHNIAGGATFKDQVFALIEWAERYSRVPTLVHAAHEFNPTNDLIQTLVQDAQEWFKVNGLSPEYQQWSTQISKISFGLPDANQIVEQELRALRQDKQVTFDDEFFELNFDNLVRVCLVERLIPLHIGNRFSSELKDALIILSPLRRLTGCDVADILATCSSAFPPPIKEEEGVRILHRLMETELIDNISRSRARIIKSPWRNILSLALKVENLALYAKVHNKAAELFGQKADLDFVEDRKDYMINHLLHRAYELNIDGVKPVVSELSLRLKTWIEKWYIQSANASNISELDTFCRLLDDETWGEELENIEPNSFQYLKDTAQAYLSQYLQ